MVNHHGNHRTLLVFGLFDGILHLRSAGWEQFPEGLNYRSCHGNLLLYSGQARDMVILLFKKNKLWELHYKD